VSVQPQVGAREAARPQSHGKTTTPPVLVPRPGGIASRFAGAIGDPHPALAFIAALLAGFLVLAAASVLIALFVVHVVVAPGGLGLGGTDEALPEWLAEHRTSLLTTLSEIGTEAGGAPVLPILVGIVAIVCAFMKRWAIAAFAVLIRALTSTRSRRPSSCRPNSRISGASVAPSSSSETRITP